MWETPAATMQLSRHSLGFLGYFAWTATAVVAFGCGASGKSPSDSSNSNTHAGSGNGSGGGSNLQAGGGNGPGGGSNTQAGNGSGGSSNAQAGHDFGGGSSAQAGSGGTLSTGGRSSTGGTRATSSVPQTGLSKGWGNVRFDGGGFVDGIVASSKEQGVIYARTDVGGVYRWNASNHAWVPLLDFLSQDNVGLYGVESIAIDDASPGRLYVLAGTTYFSNGKTVVMRSEDYGASFETVDVSSLFRAHGNGLGRQAGEKLAVDPHNSNIVFCGSRAAGLFKSSDAGKNWANVSTIGAKSGADLMSTNGIAFVLIDPSSSVTGGATSTIYLGVSDTQNGLYVSKNAGAKFDPIAGAPAGLMPNRAVLSNGNLYVTFSNSLGPYNLSNGAIYRYAVTTGTWTNLTPKTDDGKALMGNGGQGAAHGFGGVSVDPTDPNHILLTTLNFYGGQSRYADGGEGWGDRIYSTTDGGSTWRTTFSSQDPKDPSTANVSANGNAWISGMAIHWAGHIMFNPFSGKEAWVISGNGVFHSENLSDALAVWKLESKGIEETVPLDVVSVPGGPLVSAIGDYDGAAYTDIGASTPRHNPPVGTTQSLGYAPLTGEFLRGGHVTDYSTGTGIESNVMYFSENNAATWSKLATTPKGSQGLVVLSADGKVMLHRPENASSVYCSADQGKSWTSVTGLDGQAQYARIVCDPVNANVFYLLNQQGKLLKSADKGVSFTAVGSLQDDSKSLYQASNGLLRTVPGREGHLWAPLDQAQSWAANGKFSTNGLAFSDNGGTTWTRFPSVNSAHAVGIGKAAPGAAYETLFIWGVAGGANNPLGVYYSIDKGATWTRMNDDQHQFGGPGNGAFVQGDVNVFGRVYMSTVGRGLIYGNIVTP